jgi:hypothetical protein
MKTFIEYCKSKELPITEKAAVRSGIAHWAYPDGYMRSHYPSLYFTPTAADAVQKMGPSATDENKVDHGQKTYQNYEIMLRHEKSRS